MRAGARTSLLTLLRIEPAEAPLIALMLALAFCIGFAGNLTQTAAFTLFLVELDASMLSYVYIANAVVITLVTSVYLRLGRRWTFASQLSANFVFSAAVLTAVAVGVTLSSARWLAFLLPVLFQLLASLGIIAIWTLAGRVFTVQQAKRLLGLVGSGPWLAVIATGAVIPQLVRAIGTRNLLFVAVLGLVAALLLLRALARRYPERLADHGEGCRPREREAPGLLRDRYVLTIFAQVVVYWLAFVFVDNLFYERASLRHPEEAELAAFMGRFLALLGVVALLSNAVLSGRLLGRFGVRAGLLLLPALLMILAVAMAGAVGVAGLDGAVAPLFWLAAAAKLLNLAVGCSVDKASVPILYQPLPPRQRARAQTLAEGAIQAVTNGLAGLLILAFGWLCSANTLPLVYATAAASAVWLAVAVRVGRRYPTMLAAALARRTVTTSTDTTADAASIAVLRRGLESPHAGTALFALERLELLDPNGIPDVPGPLLEHPAPEVRRAALERVERLGASDLADRIAGMVGAEQDPEVLSAAVLTLASLETDSDEARRMVERHLSHPLRVVRQAALTGMLRAGGLEGVITAGQRLLRLASAPDPADRATAARVIAALGTPGFDGPLESLLADGDLGVRRAALAAAGRTGGRRLFPLVIDALGSRRTRRAAFDALVTAGDAALPAVCETLTSDASRSSSRRVQLVRVCGRVGGPLAEDALERTMERTESEVRSAAVRALCRLRSAPLSKTTLEQWVAAELWQIVELLGLLQASSLDRPLEEALAREIERGGQRVAELASLASRDGPAVRRAWDSLHDPSPERRAYATEVLGLMVKEPLHRPVLDLASDLSPAELAKRLAGWLGERPGEPADALAELLSPRWWGRLSSWTEACVVRAASTRPDLCDRHDLREQLRGQLDCLSSLARETAEWVLTRPETGNENETGTGSKTESEANMALPTFEKALFLRSVDILAETPVEALTEVAAVLEEVERGAGERIIEKGERDDCMYIIVSGGVRVHDGAHMLDTLGERDVFGEMAALDPEPRSASVTAVDDTLLLRLGREQLFELLEDAPRVAIGIIQVLSRNLRARLHDLERANRQLEEARRCAPAA